MTRQDYIFKHAAEIVNQKARTAQTLQSQEARRLCIAAVAVFRNALFNIRSFATRTKQCKS
ncbi:hypothetical protein BOA8489_02181 [Boseongicola aestuarii]|uniref:Uncharacterized protein n=1 Tax=Boseongicola aestuarii TaxID=1470561 RepID=A0A238J0A2_9RHOB|nr:hypothetical protein BOA8489_02181 [Boseongicola aestuarii]